MEKIDAYKILIDIRRIINSARLLLECQTSLSSEAIVDFRILGDLAKSVEAYAMMSKDIDFIKEVEQTQRYSLYDVLDHYELDEVTRDSLIKCLQSFAHVAPQNLANDKPFSILDECLSKESTISGDLITIIQESKDDNTSVANSNPEPPKADDKNPQRVIDVERLKDYFIASFKGIGNGNINFFFSLVEDLKMERSSKDFARIAWMIYDSKKMNHNKPATFTKWYKIFCDCVQCDQKSYKPEHLTPTNSLSKVFGYL